MSRRRQVVSHRHKLGEIRQIMNSMKSLAYMETRKLGRFIDAQQAVVRNIEEAAEDFLGFFPFTLAGSYGSSRVYLLIGSQRGFCGDYNERLLGRFESESADSAGGEPVLMAVGHKLTGLVQRDPRLVAAVAGADVVEDVERVLTRAVAVLTSEGLVRGPAALEMIYHGADGGEIRVERLLPPFRAPPRRVSRLAHAPVLNVRPRDFLMGLADEYLFAALHGVLYSALLAENLRRVQHLDAAIRHLDDKTADLTRRANVLRQEEIIEEIEVILLSAETLAGPNRPAST